MRLDENTMKTIESGELIKVMLLKQREGFRLIQVHAVSVKGGYELTYTLGKDYVIENYRVNLNENDEIPTITDLYPSAMLYENEMAVLFGVKIISTNPDYDNKFYRIKATTPFKVKEDK